MRILRPRPPQLRQTVSVVIPCYRYGHFLGDAVGSVLSQDGVDVEVLVIDDASDDDSADVARLLAASDPRVEVIVHDRNQGHIATYNEGLTRASGDYVVLLSADDALAPHALSRAVALMQHHPEVGMVYGHAESFSDELPTAASIQRSWSVWGRGRWLASTCRRAYNPVYTPSVVMRTEAWRSIGRYDARVPHAADMLLWYQTASGWGIGRINSNAQAYYRVHGANMHMTVYSGMLRDMEEQREVLRILFDEAPHAAGPSESPRRSALKSRALETSAVKARPRLQARGYRAILRRAERLAAGAEREHAPAEIIAGYRSFALQTQALLPDSGPRRIQARIRTWSDRLIDSAPAEFPRRVITHLQWRRWRRWGI